MDITPSNPRSRSRSRTRNRSTSRRPSLASKRSISSSSLKQLTVSSTSFDDSSVPSVQATLDNTLPIDFFKQDIWKLIKILKIHKWHKKPIDPLRINVVRISGALTNSIYKIEYNDNQFKIPSILLRIYGKNVDEIIDREHELDILIKLSSKKIGPKLWGIFTNGRFEQFLDGFVTLDRHQIRNEVISQMLGRRMKDLHYKVVLDYKDYKDNLPVCWKLITKWLNILESKEILKNFKDNGVKDEELFLTSFTRFKEIVFKYRDWLFGQYNSNGFASNFKFCHNDTQYGNLLLHQSFNETDIIMDSSDNLASMAEEAENENSIKNTSNKKDSSLVVIDFEYGGANFPAFDLANHFCEWMANYHNPEESYFLNADGFPSKIEQLNLIKAYVEYDFQFPSSNLKLKYEPNLNLISPTELIQFEIKKLFNECVLWRATVQIYWCIWGLIQNGPMKKEIDELVGETVEEQGIDSTYTITTGLNTLELKENAIEDEITSSDDDFNYLKYAHQKASLAMGDLIQLGLVDKNELVGEVKYLDCEMFDLP
ncbi:choline kinase [[Candida] jaroonii]|uniref:Choline kinase n=1 Tax=[Candida] jaroonii TaxID=467808 RepID=A0ACA9Y7M5_9ASCO|nr:choline kinase [[Candida] jaroonii]